MALDLELRGSVTADAALRDRIYYALMNALGQLDVAFYQSWRSLYSAWDAVPEMRIFKLNVLPYPSLARPGERQIEHRGISPPPS